MFSNRNRQEEPPWCLRTAAGDAGIAESSSSAAENDGGMRALAHLPAAGAHHRPTDPRSRRGVLPDLLSRVDQVVVFEELREQDVVEVARLKVLEAQCLAEDISVELRVDREVTEAIARALCRRGRAAGRWEGWSGSTS